ncbi:MAG: hypothetical protein RJA98_3689 [Pseudomonadota bacterium]|jgi:diguanylate cyclase (GGDEF)-like protein
MAHLVDHLADLTAFRDRDMLDVTLVGAMSDLLSPASAAIYRSVGEPGDERWINRARWRQGDPVVTADPAWTEFAHLPPVVPGTWRAQAVQTRTLVQADLPDGGQLTVFPLVNDVQAGAVLELETHTPLDATALRTVSSVLRICRNFQAVLDSSERDTLTGLLNRKTFDETFLKVASATARSDALAEISADAAPTAERRTPAAGVWLAVIDIDHFKLVNDNHGHLIGDEVLLLLSRLMRGAFRFHDQLYRFGGEEFVVLMRCNSEADAVAALQRFRLAVAGYSFPQVGHITVSVGVDQVRSGDTPNAAFERADRAVYYAKGHGRNLVCSHSDLVARGELQDDTHEGGIELF